MKLQKIHLTSLGCAKNLVDSERLLASTITSLQLQPVAEAEEADLVVINTCAFLQSAVEEALGQIMELGGRKKSGAKLMVIGCLPARYRRQEGREMAQGLPEVDLWLPPEDYHRFEEAAARLLKRPAPAQASFSPDGLPQRGRLSGHRVSATPFFRSFLKISEGCDNRCTYCLIPRLRGPLKSYPQERLISEAEELADSGARELTLVAQDITAYGLDLGSDAQALPKLVRKLSDIRKLDWIRILYAYPERLNEALIKDLAAIPKVLPYLDLPFQHASAEILKRMGRRRVNSPAELVKKLRLWWPGLALRTTLIVGFPGESEQHFEELSNFVREAAFDHLGVFKFSPEPEAPASRLPDPTPQIVKEKRRRRIMAEQKKIALAHNKARVGRSFSVLVEGPSEDSPMVMVGRAPFQAPEVDGLIYFDGEQPEAGEIVETRIIKAAPYDLIGIVETDLPD